MMDEPEYTPEPVPLPAEASNWPEVAVAPTPENAGLYDIQIRGLTGTQATAMRKALQFSERFEDIGSADDRQALHAAAEALLAMRF